MAFITSDCGCQKGEDFLSRSSHSSPEICINYLWINLRVWELSHLVCSWHVRCLGYNSPVSNEASDGLAANTWRNITGTNVDRVNACYRQQASVSWCLLSHTMYWQISFYSSSSGLIADNCCLEAHAKDVYFPPTFIYEPWYPISNIVPLYELWCRTKDIGCTYPMFNRDLKLQNMVKFGRNLPERTQ